jgi:uncharacterized protein (TIGR02646 family)
MIRIRRSATVPAALNSPAVVKAREEIKQIAANRKPKSDEFPRLWGNADVRQALYEMQSKKCAYCERLRDVNRESDIDHFRPKAEVTQPPGAPGHKGYWWLAYKWTNLLFSCRHCNQTYKLNNFPVPDETKRVSSENELLWDERAYLIDPCDENDHPESCFIYYVNDAAEQVYILACPDNEWDGERADKTIKALGLDRGELRYERYIPIKTLRLLATKMIAARVVRDGLVAGLAGPPELVDNNYHARLVWAEQKVNEAADEIRAETKSSRPFAGFRRFFFRNRDLGEYVSQD